MKIIPRRRGSIRHEDKVFGHAESGADRPVEYNSFLLSTKSLWNGMYGLQRFKS